MLMKILGAPLYKETGNIFTVKGPAERTAALKNICEKSKIALNEHGVNVLFLSFGFLEWEEDKGQRSGARQLRIKDKSFSDINELSAFLQKQLDTNERELCYAVASLLYAVLSSWSSLDGHIPRLVEFVPFCPLFCVFAEIIPVNFTFGNKFALFCVLNLGAFLRGYFCEIIIPRKNKPLDELVCKLLLACAL